MKISKFAPFEEKVKAMTQVTSSGCHLFTGTRNHDGYGRLKVNHKNVFVHREVWARRFGAIPVGMCICHKCDTPNCVNTDHLFIGTHKDNMRDRSAKGRVSDNRGEKNPAAKLKQIEVKMIRKLLADGMRNPDVAKEFGVSLPLVEKIKANKVWIGY